MLGRTWPRAWRKYPDPECSHSERSLFAEQFPDAWHRGWEEFFWRDAPFGFHLRRVGRAMAGDWPEGDRVLLDTLLRASEAGDVRW
jgi:hypothetical protein